MDAQHVFTLFGQLWETWDSYSSLRLLEDPHFFLQDRHIQWAQRADLWFYCSTTWLNEKDAWDDFDRCGGISLVIALLQICKNFYEQKRTFARHPPAHHPPAAYPPNQHLIVRWLYEVGTLYFAYFQKEQKLADQVAPIVRMILKNRYIQSPVMHYGYSCDLRSVLLLPHMRCSALPNRVLRTIFACNAEHELSPAWLDQAADCRDAGVRASVAQCPYTEPDTLRKLVHDPEEAVWVPMLLRPNLPPDIFVWIQRRARYECWYSYRIPPAILMELSRRLDTIPEVLAELGRHPDQVIRYRTARHPCTPIETLRELLSDPDSEVIHAALQTLNSLGAKW